MIRNPLVTIAVPTYNRFHQLREAVESALAQSYGNIEVLIGDNGMSQEVRGWAEGVAKRDPRLRYQSYDRNLGMAGNWNALADSAAGEFIAILADDDRLLPNYAEALLGALLEYQADLAFSNHYVIDENGRRLSELSSEYTRQYRRDLLPAGLVADAEVAVWRSSVPITASLMRADRVRELRFKEDLNTPEIELFVRFAQEAGRFAFVPEYLSEYRVHSASATNAGLWSERLAEYLTAVPAAPLVEPYKRDYMEPLLVTAVNRCLERGEQKRARQFLRSDYYPRPRWSHSHGVVQSLCASVPAVLGKPLLQFSRAVYRSPLIRRPRK
jgi:glycosyltransferase involved in cell wall biosynthesis